MQQLVTGSKYNKITTKMAVGNFTSTNSSQQLMNADAESVNAMGSVMSSIDGDDMNDDSKRPNSRNSHQYNGLSSITYSEWFAVGVLCFVNLINYMDRFTIAGKLSFIIHNRFFFYFIDQYYKQCSRPP